MENNREEQLLNIKEEVEYLKQVKKEFDNNQSKTMEEQDSLVSLYQKELEKIEYESGRLQNELNIEGSRKNSKGIILQQAGFIEKNKLYNNKTVLLHPSLADMYEELVKEIKPLYPAVQDYRRNKASQTNNEVITNDVTEKPKEVEETVENQNVENSVTNRNVTSPEIERLNQEIEDKIKKIDEINNKYKDENGKFNGKPSAREANHLRTLNEELKGLRKKLTEEVERVMATSLPENNLATNTQTEEETKNETIVPKTRLEEIEDRLNEIVDEINAVLSEPGKKGRIKVAGKVYEGVPDRRRGYFASLITERNRLAEEYQNLKSPPSNNNNQNNETNNNEEHHQEEVKNNEENKENQVMKYIKDRLKRGRDILKGIVTKIRKPFRNMKKETKVRIGVLATAVALIPAAARACENKNQDSLLSSSSKSAIESVLSDDENAIKDSLSEDIVETPVTIIPEEQTVADEDGIQSEINSEQNNLPIDDYTVTMDANAQLTLMDMLEPGQVVDVSSIKYGFRSSDSNTPVPLMTEVGKEAVFDRIVKVGDKYMVHFKQINDKGYAWLDGNEVLNVLVEQQNLNQTEGRSL